MVVVRTLFKRAHKVILPGVNGASLYEVGKFFMTELKTLKLQERAAAVTYNFLMAMPPTFLILFSILPYLPFNNVDKTIFNVLRLITPNKNIYQSVHTILVDFMSQSREHTGALSYGIILVLFFSSNGVMGLLRCFDKSQIYEVRTGVSRRWTAVKITLMLIGVIIITLAVLIVQSRDLNPYVLKIFHNFAAVKFLSSIILMLLVFITISLIYTYGPSLTQKFRFVSAGSVFATVLSIATTSVFFFLVNNFLYYNKLYGSIGTLIAFMVWVWLNTIIILLGYELNVSILLGKLYHQEDLEDEEG
ncbi:MAG: YihY/virulence factor BrkB family protein [Flavipsychrobacter sp.]|nr:YihY/virulence factor BrkB family protein [Flavipsychrobacter sp.]